VNDAVKKQFVVGLLAVFAAWPLVQGGIVRSTGMPPQQLGGWALNAEPWFPPRAVLWKQQAGAWRPLDGRELPQASRQAVIAFIVKLARNPNGASADVLGGVLRQEIPGISAVRVEVQRFELDPDTALMQVESEIFDYR